ncbi:hypothetical protein SAMN06297144_2740 [Sphingomonas guangdongensis]|uniref:Glycine-rich cell wall structural protein n=1 Tax=Sphingomonas guangdongensis TaxID=1141890 RepID=A0A285R0F3_9SPHN|nr:hypothetical protein [Sphingomonas guangdongensis]SOB87605.1 hypothetical protein SAMN06297144_2740 [Sphingomonas guangdongensis]
MKPYLILGALTAGVVAVPADAQRRRDITPYIEVSQVVTADLDGPGSDVLTYTSVAAGLDASVQTQRVEVQVSYRYEHRFAWDDPLVEDSIHSGLARGALRLGYGLNLEGGALATRARSDIRGALPGNLAGNVGNTSQLYAAYVGPTLATHVGPGTLNAAYRFGYTKVEEPGLLGLGPDQVPIDYYDDSTSHLAMASYGVRAGAVAPFGLTVSGAWTREEGSQLDQRYDGYFGRADVVQPITGQLALVGGVGYEKIEITQRDALVDATGQPVTDGSGRFVTDPASPVRLAYQTDGLIWDAGVVWRPSPRTTLEARVGQRYDTTIYTGSLSWQVSANSGLQIGVYNGVQSFGRGLRDAISALPTSFATRPDPFSDQFSGCVFGTGAGSAAGGSAGGCLNPLLGAISTANFRARGVDGVFSATRGAYTFGLGAGYFNRRYLLPPLSPGQFLYGVTDEGYYGQLFATRTLDGRSSIALDVYANYFDSGVIYAPDVLGGGANGSYSYSFGRFGATASLGVYAFDQDGISDVSGQALLGMRYSF